MEFEKIVPSDLWYLVGLITTDGCLSGDRRHISITAKDRAFLSGITKRIGLKNRVTNNFNGQGDLSFKIQIGSVDFYRFLESIGLTQKKSIILGSLAIPEEYFHDFLRGVIDGDGNISTWIHGSNKNRQWSMRISSAAPLFSVWIKERTETIFNVRGRIHVSTKENRKNPLFNVKFGKLAAQKILGICYYKGCLALERKYILAIQCVNERNFLSKYGNVI